MHTRLKRRLVAIGAIVLVYTAAAAEPQAWQEYAYPEAGFSAHFPARPTVKEIEFHAGDIVAPAKVYAVAQGSANYSVVVADLSSSAVGQDAAIDAAAKSLAGAGQTKLDVRARIDRQFGRELSVLSKAGDQMTTAVFYVDRKLYVLVGQTAPDASGLAVRFQQSLQFIDAEGKPPRRPEDGPGFGGPGLGPPGEGARRRPPAQAFADCRGKTEGAAVQHRTPRGDVVAAVCMQTPEGLAARPDRLPPGAAPDQPPEG
ncbi:MAG: hypothetical protein ACXU82_03120 [Caulobacteraceae bacterium]